MADIFKSSDARELFQNKFIFMLGDSNSIEEFKNELTIIDENRKLKNNFRAKLKFYMRATYKDLVQLINKNALLNFQDLRTRGEAGFQGDKRIAHSGMMKGRGYAEGREFLQHGVHIEYNFIARCYTEEVVRFLRRIKDGSMKPPDVFIMNSCLWDISRWGPNGVDAYKENMNKLMLLLKECLPSQTLFIWTTTLPVSSLIRGGLLIKQIDFLQDMLRFEVMEANLFCRQLIVSHGYDVLDLHYHLRMQVHRRLKDGLHYNPLPVRLITNLLLTHISLSWGIKLPGNSKGVALQRVIKFGVPQRSENVILPTLPDCVNIESNQTNKTDSVPQNNIAKPTKKRKQRNKNVVWIRNQNGQNWDNQNGQNWDNQNGQNWDNQDGQNWDNQNGQNWNQNGPNWDTQNGQWNAAEGDGWKNEGYPARNNWPPQRNVPPWRQHHPSQQYQSYWQDSNGPEDVQQAPWNKEPYQQNTYANFNRVGGPVKKNLKFCNNRTRPY